MKIARHQYKILTLVVALTPVLALGLSVCGVQALGEQVRAARRHSLPAPLNVIFAPQIAPTLGLAMADFTGDTRPDLATVSLDRVDSGNAHYWIEIRLTEGGRQMLKLTAPFGGLVITTKDITGDGNLDLVVRAAGSRAVVAVFLNEGNGHFHRARTESFTNSLPDEPYYFGLARKLIFLSAAVGCPESHAADSRRGSFHPLLEKKTLPVPARYGAPSHRFLSSTANRAPPSPA